MYFNYFSLSLGFGCWSSDWEGQQSSWAQWHGRRLDSELVPLRLCCRRQKYTPFVLERLGWFIMVYHDVHDRILKDLWLPCGRSLQLAARVERCKERLVFLDRIRMDQDVDRSDLNQVEQLRQRVPQVVDMLTEAVPSPPPVLLTTVWSQVERVETTSISQRVAAFGRSKTTVVLYIVITCFYHYYYYDNIIHHILSHIYGFRAIIYVLTT